MNCLSIEQLVSLIIDDAVATQPDKRAAAREHVRHCLVCAAGLREVEEDLGRVARAHAWCDTDHEAGRRRMLAALPSLEARRSAPAKENCFRGIRGARIMHRMWLSSAAAILVVMGLFLVWQSAASDSALAQTAKALGKVTSYRCRVAGVEAGADKDTEQQVGVWYWAAPGSYRMDLHEEGKLVRVSIAIRGKPGLEIDHKYQTYQRAEPVHQPDSPVELFHELAKFAGKADRELPEREIKGTAARGFEIALDKIDPDRDEGTLRVWPDPQTKLPLRVELDIPDSGTMILDDFAWNVATDKWFGAGPPAKYHDETPGPASVEEQTEQIVRALKAYAKYCDGKYPQVRMMYGDVSCRRLFKAAGLSNPHNVAPREEQLTAEYAECSPARLGFAVINTIQRHNPDAAYYGKTVGPNDKDKVLFRWKLADGQYQVIFGDLRAESVTAKKLQEHEKR
jgi:outer membrane lipoprotein-sorting protein